MPYSSEISRTQPACIFFLIDQSTSMNLPIAGDAEGSRAERLTEAINRLLQELVVRCTKSQEEGVRAYFEVGVFGYGSESFGPVLGGELAGKPIVSVRDLAEHPLRLETRVRRVADGEGGIVDAPMRYPVWFDLDALGKTPMCAALRETHAILERWTRQHRASLPPLVFNITDGEATDGNPSEEAAALRSLATDDGHLLLFNVHLSDNPQEPILYPSLKESLPDEFAQQLFEMSSKLPPPFLARFQEEGLPVHEGARAFVFNGGIVEVIQCLDIGTRLKMRI